MYFSVVTTVLLFMTFNFLFLNVHATDVNVTDLNRCKVTHKGVGYTGQVSRTAGGVRCQHWQTDYPVHIPSDAIMDELFPDGSRKAARNYCRNPLGDDDGPWCYTIDEKLRNDYCDVPLCYYQECRLTGPGMEYAGSLSRSGSQRDCLSWLGSRDMLFLSQRFPGGWRVPPRSQCRNPDGDPAGPWCYVRARKPQRGERKDYCDVPLCDEPDCMAYTTGAVGGTYSLYTMLNASWHNLTLGVKLWHPDVWRNATAAVALSMVATPASGPQLRAWGVGMHLPIAGVDGSAGTNRVRLTGTEWSWMWLRWGHGRLEAGLRGSAQPLLVEQVSPSSVLLNTSMASLYFSLAGPGILWSLPSCERVDWCTEEVTSRLDFPRLWPMKASETGHQISLFLRAAGSAVLELRVSPTMEFPSLQVMLAERNVTRVTVRQNATSAAVVLAEVGTPGLLNYWQWREFSVRTLGEQLGLLWIDDTRTKPVLEARHDTVRSVRWFGLGSDYTAAHWTLYCRPRGELPLAIPPECAVTRAEVGYAGGQRVTGSGRPCIPWTDERRVPPDLRQLARRLPESLDRCRNLDHDPDGPFCLAEGAGGAVEREPCLIRPCQSVVCRRAGTANDYIGQLNVTRSNRQCQKWTANTPHLVNQTYHNDTLYPEQSAEEAANYCRNPSRNSAGTWCYTTDPAVVADLCYVPDCDRPEECTTFTRGAGIGRLVYVLPEWRTAGLNFWLKEWDPDLPDGLDIFLRPLEGDRHYRLVIGAENNEKVYFIYNDGKENHLLRERTLPHLIPTGKWGAFWLRILPSEVQLGYQGVDNPLFSWTAASADHALHPTYVSFTSLVGYMIAISFDCNDCHVERTSTERYTKIYPVGLWSRQPGTRRYERLVLYMRGTGMALVALLTQIGTGNYHALIIGKDKNKLFLSKQTGDKAWALTGTLAPFSFIDDKWAKFEVTFRERFIMVARNEEVMFQYNHTSPFLFYYFTLAAEEGYVDWSANCQPPDVDLPVRDGGWSPWSPWTCSVTCGGGLGMQKRSCDNPRPNVYGQPCVGSDTRTGRCNDFPCGDISPDTEERLRHRLRTRHWSTQVEEGDPVTLKCGPEVVAMVRHEVPRPHLDWTKGDGYLQPSTRVVVSNTTVVIHSTSPGDSGVYMCVLHRATRLSTALCVHALAVRPSSATISVRETRPLTLACGGAALGVVYSGLAQHWVHQGAVWHAITTPAVDELVIAWTNRTHAGEWKCLVLQTDLGFVWTTGWALVKVGPPPTLLTYLMEDDLTRPLLQPLGSETAVLVVLVALALLVVAVVAALVFLYLRYGTLP